MRRLLSPDQKSAMKPTRFRFAPVSGSPSTALRMASGWFIFNGAVYGLFVIGAVVGIVAGWDEFREVRVDWIRVIASAVSAVTTVWTGVLIWRSRRLGGVLAIGLFILQILSSLFTVPFDIFPVILSGIGVLVLISIWGELT